MAGPPGPRRQGRSAAGRRSGRSTGQRAGAGGLHHKAPLGTRRGGRPAGAARRSASAASWTAVRSSSPGRVVGAVTPPPRAPARRSRARRARRSTMRSSGRRSFSARTVGDLGRRRAQSSHRIRRPAPATRSQLPSEGSRASWVTSCRWWDRGSRTAVHSAAAASGRRGSTTGALRGPRGVAQEPDRGQPTRRRRWKGRPRAGARRLAGPHGHHVQSTETSVLPQRGTSRVAQGAAGRGRAGCLPLAAIPPTDRGRRGTVTCMERVVKAPFAPYCTPCRPSTRG